MMILMMMMHAHDDDHDDHDHHHHRNHDAHDDHDDDAHNNNYYFRVHVIHGDLQNEDHASADGYKYMHHFSHSLVVW